jgi:prepilin-type processing-associated H-X9-DG protein
MKHTRAMRQPPLRYSAGGFTLFDVLTILVVILALLLLVGVIWPAYQRARILDIRRQCGMNLMEIGEAMIAYASDYDGIFPMAGSKGTIWGPGLADWRAETCDAAFGFDPNGTGGAATISSSLYLLVRSGQASPDLFVCPKDRGTAVFRPGKHQVSAKGLTGVWDFGPDPARHCSYSYHMPYSRNALTTSSPPGVVVAADRSPWIDGPRQKAAEFSRFKPDIAPFKGTPEEGQRGNSLTHRIMGHHPDGQNVFFLDGHVQFARRAFCGLEDDNIYTAWDGEDRARGTLPKPYESQPGDARDSLLLNDPPLRR